MHAIAQRILAEAVDTKSARFQTDPGNPPQGSVTSEETDEARKTW